MKTCLKCQNAEAKHGLDCPRCDVLMILSAMVCGKWRPEELRDLSETLRSASVVELIKQRVNAVFLQNLLRTMQRLCVYRGFGVDDMKMSLVRRIEQIVEVNRKIAEHDNENGEGSYMKTFNAGCSDAFSEMRAKLDEKIKRQPVPV